MYGNVTRNAVLAFLIQIAMHIIISSTNQLRCSLLYYKVSSLVLSDNWFGKVCPLLVYTVLSTQNVQILLCLHSAMPYK